MLSKPSRWITVALIGAAVFFVWQTPPESNPILPRCPVLKHTGLYCSGCGSLRAIHSLLHGNLGKAWTMNPLTVSLVPLLILLVVDDLFLQRNMASKLIRPVFIWLLLGLFIVFGIMRNLPFFPFTVLAPH